MIQELERQWINIRPGNCIEGAANKVHFNRVPETNTKQFYYIRPSVGPTATTAV
jgi:hypothetical protein